MAKQRVKPFQSKALAGVSGAQLADPIVRRHFGKPKLVHLQTMHPHYEDRGFVLVLRRRGVQYALSAGIGGEPLWIGAVKGRVTVTHEHRGYGAYALKIHADAKGEWEPSLDPICEAVMKKGWMPQNIEMALRLSKRNGKPFPPTYACEFKDLPLRRKYVSIRKRYMIIGHTPGPHPQYDGRLSWAIYVDYRKPEEEYRAQEFSFKIHAAVPWIYDDPQALAGLLKAIEGLPSAEEMKDFLHPTRVKARAA